MKFKFLGTAAAEGFPAIFCRCEACETARRKKGKNIRSRSQALINNDLLIDWASDSYAHALRHDLRLDEVKYIVITHSHSDHCALTDLQMRGGVYAHKMAENFVALYGNREVKKRYESVYKEMDTFVRAGYSFIEIEAYKAVRAGDYEIMPLPARHMSMETPFVYVISYKGKHIFYCLDTGYLFEAVFEFLKKRSYRFDMVALDCTLADNLCEETSTHMNGEFCIRVAERLRINGNIDKNTKLYVTHFSHNGNPIQKRLEAMFIKFGINVAYDGLEIEF